MKRLSNGQTSNDFNFNAARKTLDRVLAEETEALRNHLAGRTSLAPAAEALAGFLSQPGKRIRPLTFLAGFDLLTAPDQRSRPPLDVACALELFHAFILIHDDIIDQSDQRRGRPSLHRRLADGDSDGTGEASALVLGDIVSAWANGLFLRDGLPAKPSLAALRYHLEVARDTGIGELMDIRHAAQSPARVPPESVLETYHLKTTRYTFEAPLVLAGILTEAPAEWFPAVTEVCRPLGTAFQLENDLNEVEMLVAGAIAESDFRESSLSLPIVRLAQWKPTGVSPQSATQWNGEGEGLRRAVVESDMVEVTRREIEELFAEADTALRSGPLPKPLQSGLGRILAFIKENRSSASRPAVASQ